MTSWRPSWPHSPSADHFCGSGPRGPSIQTKYHCADMLSHSMPDVGGHASLCPPVSLSSLPHDLRHLRRGRGVAAALGAHEAVDDGHADAGQVTEPDAVEQRRARRMLRLVHDDEVRGTAD